MTGLRAVISLRDELLHWLRDAALPLWDRHGVDRAAGGFFESLRCGAAGAALEASGEVRRGRVVARQIYVFDVGRRLGWRSGMSDPVVHGCDYLFSRLHAGEGVFHSAVDALAHRPSAPFSLYEQAFYLFALARSMDHAADRYPVAATAARCLEHLRGRWGRTSGGFEESDPPSVPLKSNPHMHLLEAALAWIDVSATCERPRWIELAREMVGLCLLRFRDVATGAVGEYFDREWRALPGGAGQVIEPGHQFEWSWLLLQWSNSPHADADERAACGAAAARLIDLGERCGVDALRGVAMNELWGDLSPKDSAAKLWPQTERLKAWCAVLERARTTAEVAHACRKVAAAGRGLTRYLRTETPGLWHELCTEEGEFPAGPAKASSLYHLVCAIEVLTRTVAVVS